MDPISLDFMIEKREEHGEDAQPLSIIKENLYAVGVFDGLGGSGAAICKSGFGEGHTKAYVASRIIRDAVANYIEKATDIKEIDEDGIKLAAKRRLEEEKYHFPTKASGLRSRLVRDYPTTLAITVASVNKESSHTVVSYWAGDSRNYLWNQEGFYQISKDDLDTELDPLENLRNDAALSNCVCADRDFTINSLKIDVLGKFIIISATDGCFNYFATPMHFQEILLTGLKLAESKTDWENYCKEEITAVTGDDVSLALLAIGFDGFDDLKDFFKDTKVSNIEDIRQVQDEINSLAKKIEHNKEILEELVQSGWNEYKVSYMKYFNTEDSNSKEPCEVFQQESSLATENEAQIQNSSNEETDISKTDPPIRLSASSSPMSELHKIEHSGFSRDIINTANPLENNHICLKRKQ